MSRCSVSDLHLLSLSPGYFKRTARAQLYSMFLPCALIWLFSQTGVDTLKKKKKSMILKEYLKGAACSLGGTTALKRIF